MIGKIGDHPYAVPVSAVERTLPMAALLRLPEVPQDVVGVLNLYGAVLAVVDPRPRLGHPTPPFHADQRLVVLRAGTRYLLWIDGIERIASAAVQPFDELVCTACGIRLTAKQTSGYNTLAAESTGTTPTESLTRKRR